MKEREKTQVVKQSVGVQRIYKSQLNSSPKVRVGTNNNNKLVWKKEREERSDGLQSTSACVFKRNVVDERQSITPAPSPPATRDPSQIIIAFRNHLGAILYGAGPSPVQLLQRKRFA